MSILVVLAAPAAVVCLVDPCVGLCAVLDYMLGVLCMYCM